MRLATAVAHLDSWFPGVGHYVVVSGKDGTLTSNETGSPQVEQSFRMCTVMVSLKTPRFEFKSHD